MDRERFDELARLLATKGSRRSALGAIFGVAILGHDPEDADAKNGKKGRKDRSKNNKNRNNSRNQNKGNNTSQNNGGDIAQRQGEPELQAEEVAAVPESTDAPEVQAETAPGRKRRGKGRGKGKGKGKGKDGNQGQSANRVAQPQAQRCCGIKSCTKPTAGSNRSECNFASQDLSGRTMTGVNFTRIDGRKTIFTNANVKGSNFSNACLQGATFRGTNVSSTNWDKACLFFADFTGARNLNVTVNLSSALLCGTIMPDGTVGTIGNRDCGKANTCCSACDAQRPCTGDQLCCNGRCVEGECCATGDCDDQQCQTKSCVGNQCDYTPVIDGTGPLCANRCCDGVCCGPNQVCNANDVCCTKIPEAQACAGKCGKVSDGCGGTYE